MPSNLSKSPTVFQASQNAQFIYSKQMANNGGAVTSPRLMSQQDRQNISFIPKQGQSTTVPFMGYASPMQAHPQGSQAFMMPHNFHSSFTPVTQYSHMGLASQQFTPTNLASLLQGQ